jgi:hypothetical protein
MKAADSFGGLSCLWVCRTMLSRDIRFATLFRRSQMDTSHPPSSSPPPTISLEGGSSFPAKGAGPERGASRSDGAEWSSFEGLCVFSDFSVAPHSGRPPAIARCSLGASRFAKRSSDQSRICARAGPQGTRNESRSCAGLSWLPFQCLPGRG